MILNKGLLNASQINKNYTVNGLLNAVDLKLDKVTTNDVEKVYIKNADGTQGMKPVSEFGGGEENVQSDWNQTNILADDFIKNKPELFSGDYNDLINTPALVTNHSELNLDDGTNPHGTTKNDVGLGNADNTSDLGKPISNSTQTALNGKANTIHSHVISDVNGLQTALNSKLDKVTTNDVEKVYIKNADGTQGMKPSSDFQDILVSGTNIKTINGNSILGSGNLIVGGGGSDLGLLKLTDTPPPTGKHRGDVQTAGTYTNFGGIVFTQPELDNNYGYIYVDEGVSTKILSAKPAVDLTPINTKISSVEKLSAFNTGEGLPMVLQSSTLTNITSSSGGIITPQMFNNFLLDLKLKGTAEAGFTYGLERIQYNHTAGAPYENYLAFQKISNGGVNTVIGRLYLPSTIQRGIGAYTFALTADASTVTEIKIAVNWESIFGIVGGVYTPIYDKGYRFDNDYLFSQNTGYLAEKAKLDSISTDVMKALNKVTTTETTTWQLANDTFASTYAYKNNAQYTKRMTVATAFSQVNLQKVAFAGTVTYKVYIVNELATRGIRDTPTGVISGTTHTLLKEGTIAMTATAKDYKISLGDAFICPVGSQVVVYMSAADSIDIAGVSGGAGTADSNPALLSTSSTPFAGGSWVAGSFTGNTGYFTLALKLVNVPLFEIAGANDVVVENYLKLTIPNKIYAVVGTEINLYNDAISYSIDRGLVSPLNYQTKWNCVKGTIVQRGFRFTPLVGDVGTHSCTCEIYDMGNVLITSKTFQIIVQSKAAPTTIKRGVYFGDSLGLGVADELYNNFNNTTKYSGAIPIFAGTKGTTKKYEAVGGYRWADYATAGRRAFRVQVSGIGAVTLNSTYTNNGFTWTIIEVNVTGGNGNLLITKQDTGGSDAPSASGNLVPTAGGTTIAYTGAILEAANPLWNSTTNAMDVPLYKSRLGLISTDKIDVVSFQFGINDHTLANDLPTLLGYITTLYNAFIADNPTCKFIIGLPTSAGNTVDGSGANYGATYNWKALLENTYKIRQYLLTLEGSASFPNLIIAPASLGLDRYYGYALADRAVSARNSTTEKYHINFVHPETSGYGQIADMYLGSYIYALST